MLRILTELYLIIGSYGLSTDECVKIYHFNEDTGDAEYVCGCSGISNPSFLTVASDGAHVYAVGEDEGITATANSLMFDRKSQTLELTSSMLTFGGAPCHIALTPNEEHVLTANYHGGSVTEFPVGQDGRLNPGKVIKFQGKSVDPNRQTQPHLHAVNFTPDDKYMVANDLGTDKLHVFPVVNGMPEGSEMTDLKVEKGAGPRHLCFDSEGRHAYLISELSGEVFTLDYQSTGEHPFTIAQTVKADGFDGRGSADIHLSYDGKFLYASHRIKGDGLSIFSVDSEGRVSKIGYQPTAKNPRNFAITPNDKYLLVGSQDQDVVEIYQRDPSTGLLTDTGKRIEMSKPVCLQFFR